MVQVGTRKRPAPGASPLDQMSNYNSNDAAGMPNSNQDMSYGWQGPNVPSSDPAFVNDSSFNPYNGMPVTQQGQVSYPNSSNQMVRRPMNQNLVSQDYGNQGGQWSNQAQVPLSDGWQTSYDDLDQRAEVAKRDAQAKRKQIPPFIQKLSRFVRNLD